MNNLPVVFELTSGCSVGCPFCGVSSGKFKGVFRHTDENAALWQDVLARLHKSVGDVVGNAICYYATEPLDNPDYELFIEDFYNEFGQVPSTTTALALRNVERTRNLLQWGQRIPGHTDRISVLSSQDFETIITTFTPEELVFTDLLPHFEEAPVCALRRAGRNRDAAQGNEETISCVSGFVVNMWERSVRLLTPTLVNDEHPTGELILETASFTDGASLEKAISDMVGRHMHETIGIADILGVKQKP